MTSALGLPPKVIVLAVVLPVAALMGYLLATPENFGTFMFVGLVLTAIVLPTLLGYHHPLLIFSWNFTLTLYFLPGNPNLWMLMSLVSLGLSVVARNLNKNLRLLNVPSLTWPLLLFALVVVVTAQATGGLGLKTMGGSLYGGKKYVTILFAIVGYFALSVQPIPLEKAMFYTGAYFLSGFSLAISNFIYMVPALWFLYAFFPVEYAVSQIVEDFQGAAGGIGLGRLAGVGFSAMSGFNYLLLRYGIRGLLDLRRPWRLAFMFVILAVSLLGGFRSVFVLYALVLAAQFVFEGLLKTRLFPALILAGILGFVGLVALAPRLPFSIQRSLSVLPLDINPAVRADAQASSEWRLGMWKALLPEVPMHFWLGKGYTANESEYYLTMESRRRGLGDPFEMSRVAGDYHSGPLSLIIPFGIWGVLAFGAFLIAAGRALYLNYRNGLPALRSINTFFFAFFIARVFFYFVVFGAVNSDMALFCGVVGLSVSLNRGVCTRPVVSEGA